jgi:DNA-directed RNA polymerase specialized sigma24 family protein
MVHEPPHPDDDPVVIAGAEPFEAFFRREYQPVLGLAFVLCGSHAVAEELTMDAFESPGAWVRKVVSNSSVSRFRRVSAEARARLRLMGGVGPSALDGSGDVEVWEAVRRLSRRQAQVVALFYVEGFSRAEVARILGLSEESVKTHLERARRQLEKELGDAQG